MITTVIILVVAAIIAYARWGRGIGTKSVTAIVTPPNPPSATVTPTPTTPVATSPTPTPAPVVSAKSYGWVWWIIAILAAIIAYYVVLPALRTSAPSPQVAAPKKEGHGSSTERALKVTFQNNRHFILKAEDVPWTENARYLVVFRLIQARPGKLFIEINGGKGGDGPFDFDSYITGEEITVVFFENGLRGNPKYFVPGTNWIKLYSPEGGPITIRYAQIITYWE